MFASERIVFRRALKAALGSRDRVRDVLAVGAFAMSCACLAGPSAGAQDLKVYSPIVEEGEFGIEARGNVTVDKNRDKAGAQNQRYELEYTPTDFWHTALVGELTKAAEGSLKYNVTAWENIFQIFPQGKEWLDLGFYLEYESAKQRGSADALEWKLLVEKNFGPLTLTLNPIFEKEVGRNAEKSTEFKYASRLKLRLMPQVEPAIEAYGDIGEIGNLDSSSAQRHQVGPALLGKFHLGNASALKYEIGYMFGLTRDGSPDGAFKWLIEIEHHF
jgi:hypothetical protein